jgi:hypothetical protein
VILYSTKSPGCIIPFVKIVFSILTFGSGSGVEVTQSHVSGIFDPETVAQFVNVVNVYHPFTFHVKYTTAVHQFAFSVIPVYNT